MSKSSGIATDTRYWPIVMVRFPTEDIVDEDLIGMIEEHRLLLARRQRFAMVGDGRVKKIFTATQRKILVDWMEEAEPLVMEHLAAMAMVVDSAPVRGALTAVLWLKKMEWPTKVTKTLDQSIAFCVDRLREEGVPVTHAVQRIEEDLGVKLGSDPVADSA